jgi:hypothetical protein
LILLGIGFSATGGTTERGKSNYVASKASPSKPASVAILDKPGKKVNLENKPSFMSKEEMKNLDKLKTELRIPFKWAPEDPEFIIKKHEGSPLTE